MVDTNNWRPTASGSEPAMDTSDWRAQLTPESRQRIVNRIWDTLKRCFSGQEGLQELKKFAVLFEEKIFIAATSQSDYLRIVSLKMLSMEKKSENTILYSAGNVSDSPDLEAHGMQLQVHNPAQALPISLSANQSQGSQQLLSQNVQNNMTTSGVQSSVGLQSAMPSVSGLTHTPIPIAGSQNPNMQNISGISQNSMGNSVGQGVTSNMFEAEQILMETNNWRPTAPGGEPAIDTSDWRTQLPPESRQRIVNKIMDTLKRHLPFSGQEGLQELKKIAVRFEEKIFTAATSQSDYLRQISLKMLSMEIKSQSAIPNSAGNNSKPPDVGASHSMQPHVHNLVQALPIPLSANQSQGRQPLLSQNIQNNMTTSGFQTSLDSTAQTVHPSGGDWQEEIYQKVKAMKEMYLPDLNEMYQKIAVKLQQHESLSQQPKSDQLDKLKLFKTMLERLIAFLQVSKNNIVPSLKDKLAPYEKQIVNFINTNRSRNRILALQQGQLPQFHLQSLQQPQSQISQLQSHENHMNPQLQTMNLKGYVPTMQQNNMSSLQQSSLSSLSGVSTSQQNIMNLLHPGSNLDSGQGNSLSSLQQVALQQNPASISEQPSQQQLMPQIQSQPAQLQQQLGLQQQSNPLQRDIQQRLEASGQAPGSFLQTQDAIDQQKQIYQSQSVLPETSTEMEDCCDTCNNVNNEDPYEYEGPIVQCWCNPPLKAPRWMSWSSNNPGRRFYSCPNYKKGNGCKFFEWHDKEAMPEYAKQVILEFKETVKTLKAEINCDYRQNEQLKDNYAQLKSQIHGSRKNVQIMVHDGNVENYGVFHYTALEENVMKKISVLLKIFVIASILFSLFLCISMKLV